MSSFSQSSSEKQAQQIRALGSNLVRIADLQLENEKLQEVLKEVGLDEKVSKLKGELSCEISYKS